MLRIDCNGHTVRRSSLCMFVIHKLPAVSLHSVLPPGEERRDKEHQAIRGYVRLRIYAYGAWPCQEYLRVSGVSRLPSHDTTYQSQLESVPTKPQCNFRVNAALTPQPNRASINRFSHDEGGGTLANLAICHFWASPKLSALNPKP